MILEYKKKFVFLALVVVFLFIAGHLLVSFFVLPIDKNFSYSADIISLDNFYDSKNKDFGGEVRSVTTFSYKIKDIEGKKAFINNTFDVRTIIGDRIIKIDREYVINRFNNKHLSLEGFEKRDGYLFVPRNISKDDSFVYWHVNYNVPLRMEFQNEDLIEGLRVYKYSTNFRDDQTSSLTHLDGVPDMRGVNLDGTLSLWVEPITGHMIAYKDSSVAYFYDQSTGKRIEPWNKFKNKFTKDSISSHVSETRHLLTVVVFFRSILPLIALIVGLGFIFYKKDKFYVTLYSSIFILLLLLFLFYQTGSFFFGGNTDPLQIGISRWVSSENNVYNENVQGFKDAFSEAGFVEGDTVVYYDRTSSGDKVEQLKIIQEFIQKDVDLVYSITTPGTTLIKEGLPHKPIIFSIVTYPIESGLIESLLHSGNNLVGTRNWVSSEDQLDNFLELIPSVQDIAFLKRRGESNSSIQFEEMMSVGKERGVNVIKIEGDSVEELMERLYLALGRIDGVYSSCDTLIQGQAESYIIGFVKTNKLPSFTCNQSGVEKGDLMSTAGDFYLIGKEAGNKALFILNGASPQSLETTTVSIPRLYINKDRADELEIMIPQPLILRAYKILP